MIARMCRFAPYSVGFRAWGREIVVAHVAGKYLGKVLRMRAGTKGGLQYHRVKDESHYILSGELLVRTVVDGELCETRFKAGEAFHTPAGVVHQEEAITDCVLIEFSTPVFDDRVRVEREYGLDESGGLPTTERPCLG